MTSNLSTYTFPLEDKTSGYWPKVRVLRDDKGDPWFVAKDVCDALAIANVTQAVTALDDDERAMFSIGRQGSTNIINESGLYSLILRSRKPEARRFKKWVTSEVLPSIRKHGMYATEDTLDRLLADPETTIRMLEAYRDEKNKRIALEGEVKELAPKADFADSTTKGMTEFHFSNAVRHFGISVPWMHRIMEDALLLHKNHRPTPYAYANGYLKPAVYYGREFSNGYRITPKGMELIRQKLMKEEVA